VVLENTVGRRKLKPLAAIGRGSGKFTNATGDMMLLFLRACYWLKELPRNLPSVFRQVSFIGVSTLPIAAVMALFVGMVLALQTGYQLLQFRQLRVQEYVGAIVGLSMAKELGPVMTAYLLAGRVGAAITAEIGSMAVSEEIDALKVMGINPVRFLAMPRLVACTLSLPLLVIYSELIGIMGGALVATTYVDIPTKVYFDNMLIVMSVKEISNGLVKALVFGTIVGVVGCYQGFTTTGGATGVGRATTRSVVTSFMLILIADYFLWRMLW